MTFIDLDREAGLYLGFSAAYVGVYLFVSAPSIIFLNILVLIAVLADESIFSSLKISLFWMLSMKMLPYSKQSSVFKVFTS